jgi:hypothetical protein
MTLFTTKSVANTNTATTKRVPMLASAIIMSSALWLSGCNKVKDDAIVAPKTVTTDTFGAEVATKWADLNLKLIKGTAGFTPPLASRALAYTGVTLYESVVPGIANRQSMAGQLSSLTVLPRIETDVEYNWAISANAAQASITKSLFVTTSLANKNTIDSLENALNSTYKTSEVTMEVFDRSVKFGQSIATAIFEWSKSDGGHEGYTRNQPKDYVPPVGPGLWIQTTAGDAGRAVQPSWGKNRTFVIANSIIDPPAPLKYSTDVTSPFFAQGLEVYTTVKNLTDDQKTIAKFWADGGGSITPPGHSISLTSIAIKKDNANLAKAAEAYAKVGISVADAFICCWKCKYTYNLMRPETYIKIAIDPSFKPLLTTPPFPEHLSGHSTQSGAAMQVLSDMFGYNFSIVDNTNSALGFKDRAYDNFFDAGQEAAVSRLYGGIHFRTGNELGITEGKKIGKNVLALNLKK